MYSEMLKTVILLTVLCLPLAWSQPDLRQLWQAPMINKVQDRITTYWCDNGNHRLAPGQNFYNATNDWYIFQVFYSKCISRQNCSAPQSLVDELGLPLFVNDMAWLLVCIPGRRRSGCCCGGFDDIGSKTGSYFDYARTTENITTSTKDFGFLIARPGPSNHHHTFHIETREGCGAGLIIYYVYANTEKASAQISVTRSNRGRECQPFWKMHQRVLIKSSGSISFQPCSKIVRFCVGYFSVCWAGDRSDRGDGGNRSDEGDGGTAEGDYLWNEPLTEYWQFKQQHQGCQIQDRSIKCTQRGRASTTESVEFPTLPGTPAWPESGNSPASTDSSGSTESPYSPTPPDSPRPPHALTPTETLRMPTQTPEPGGTDGQAQLNGAVVGGSIAGGLILALILLAIILVILWKRNCLIVPIPKPKPAPMREMVPSTLSGSNAYEDIDEAYSELYQYVVPPNSWPDPQPTAQSDVQPDVLPGGSETYDVVKKRKGSLTMVENDLYDNVQNIDQAIGQRGNASRASAGIYIVENDTYSGSQ